jgi:hypothetical protein
MAANLEIGENSTKFDLLVGYDTKNSLEGIVNVEFPGAVPVNTDSPFEVLGQIKLNITGGITLSGVALHQVR